jgi:hypothetical protein
MTEPTPDTRPTPDNRMFPRDDDAPGMAAADVIAIALTLVWLLLVAVFFLVTDGAAMPGGTLGIVMTLVSVFVPVALIWVAAVTARTARGMRAEARRLQSSIDAMRAAYVSQMQSGTARPSVEKKLDELAAAQRQTETTIATFTSRRDGALPQRSDNRKAALVAPGSGSADEQPALALGTTSEDLQNPVSVADFIRALNFPDNPDDKEGFLALRRALDDRSLTKLVRAAQDVLTLLSQDGIYMDDLKPDRARTDIWRRFARGERGRMIAALGGVRDRSSLALTAGRMRQDTIFRDASHHFLRTFDKTFSEFEKNASDQDLAELAETRTARAFMLLGRVTGTFD